MLREQVAIDGDKIVRKEMIQREKFHYITGMFLCSSSEWRSGTVGFKLSVCFP